MTFKVDGGILELAIDRLVRLFDNRCSSALCPREVSFHFFQKDSQALGACPQLGRTLKAFTGCTRHDPGVAQMQLSAGDRIPVVKVLYKAENAREPFNRPGQIAVNDVRQNDIGRHRAVANHGDSIRPFSLGQVRN